MQEITLREHYPTAKVISYDDTPLAFVALRNGNVQAITQDDAKLVGLLGNLPAAQKPTLKSLRSASPKNIRALVSRKAKIASRLPLTIP